MRMLFWILMIGSCGGVVGCSEIVRPVEQSTSSTVDVVGEPSDPTAESTQISDILGSAAALSEKFDSVADSHVDSANSAGRSDEASTSAEEASEPDVVGSQGTEKSEPVKTSKRDVSKAE